MSTATASGYNFAYLDEQTKRMIRRAILKAIAIPGYQVPFAAEVKAAASKLKVATVGMIVEPHQAESVIASGQADLVALARAFLDDPRWPLHAAAALGASPPYPPQYERASPKLWAGYALKGG